ncbi:hypothetical protein EYZ11_003684 [Aspergillus tanneri]|uniref:Uncharacterized protein n=1 Tax=Aspergillus tanneri TaxID=1220188 RepID=A0A4S3JN50_9EURO|nr:hypothetical protein EYZ11_003684 [Aspergillus tanneri]
MHHWIIYPPDIPTPNHWVPEGEEEF